MQDRPHIPQEHLADFAGRHPCESVHLEVMEIGVCVVWPYVGSIKKILKINKTLPKESFTTKKLFSHVKHKLMKIAFSGYLIQANKLIKYAKLSMSKYVTHQNMHQNLAVPQPAT